MILKPLLTTALIGFCISVYAQELSVKGAVYDNDSITPMQFAYVINKNASIGIATDEKGNFNLHIHLGDTLCFSYVGYFMTKLQTHLLKDSVKNSVLMAKIYLKQKVSELRTAMIVSHSFSKEIKETYQRKIDEYNRGISSPLASPISALYYSFSHKGKELEKLSFLYQQLMMDEIKENRLSAERIRNITGNDTLNIKDFSNYCYFPDQFISSASDYELFLSVKRYYRQYMDARRKKE